MTSLHIPTITEDDILAFHHQVYGKAFAGPSNTDDISLIRSNPEVGDLDLDDDYLGYYPDGVKRTLTDEQIAMFRHSEIQSLLREQRYQRELRGEESQEVVETTCLLRDSSGVKLKNTADKGIKEVGIEDPEDDDEEEYARFLEAEQEEMRSVAAKQKRKRSYETVNTNSRNISTRRTVRELDSAPVAEDVLDYGDEPTTKSVQTEASESSINTAPSELQLDHEPREGRKIWWPTIKK